MVLPAVHWNVTVDDVKVEPGGGLVMTAEPGAGVSVGVGVAVGVGVGVAVPPGVGVGVGGPPGPTVISLMRSSAVTRSDPVLTT